MVPVDPANPLSVIVYDYPADGKRLMHAVAVLDEIAAQYGITRHVLERFIAEGCGKLIAATHMAGYSGTVREADGRIRSDSNIHNVRIILEGRLRLSLTGDFGLHFPASDQSCALDIEKFLFGAGNAPDGTQVPSFAGILMQRTEITHENFMWAYAVAKQGHLEIEVPLRDFDFIPWRTESLLESQMV